MRPSLGPVVEDTRQNPRGLPGAQKGTLGEGQSPRTEGRTLSGQVASLAALLLVPGAEAHVVVGGRRPRLPSRAFPTDTAGMCWTHQGLDSLGAGHSGRGTGAFQLRSLQETTGSVGGDARRLRPQAGEPPPSVGAEVPREGQAAVGARPSQPPLLLQQPPTSGSALRCAARGRPLLPGKAAGLPRLPSGGWALRAAGQVAGLWSPRPAPPGPLRFIRPSAQPSSRPQPPRLGPGIWPQPLSLSTSARTTVGAQPAAAPILICPHCKLGSNGETAPAQACRQHALPGTKSSPAGASRPHLVCRVAPHPASSASPMLLTRGRGGQERRREDELGEEGDTSQGLRALPGAGWAPWLLPEPPGRASPVGTLILSQRDAFGTSGTVR